MARIAIEGAIGVMGREVVVGVGNRYEETPCILEELRACS
jgi:hypothetical protein